MVWNLLLALDVVSLLNLVLKVWDYAWLRLRRKWRIIGFKLTSAMVVRACKTSQILFLIILYNFWIHLILTLVMIFGRQILKIKRFLNTFYCLWGLNRLRSVGCNVIVALVSSTLSLHVLIRNIRSLLRYFKGRNSYGTTLITFKSWLLHVFSTLMRKLTLIFCNSLLLSCILLVCRSHKILMLLYAPTRDY